MRSRAPHSQCGLALVALLGCLLGCRTSGGRAPTGPVVRAIDFEGEHAVSESDLEGKIATSETSWLPFAPKRRFDPYVWRADLQRVERYYQARGYYQAQVVDSRIEERGDGVRLTVRVEEGGPTRISSVEVRGLEALPPEVRRAVEELVTLKPGELFTERSWLGLDHRLRNQLWQEGYALAEVAGRAEVDVDTREAALSLVATPGERFLFGELEIRQQPGAHIDRWRIEELARLSIRPGARYSLRALSRARERLLRLGVFGAVQVFPGKPAPGAVVMPVVVDVTESRFHTVRAGAGLEFQPPRTEARAIGSYSDRNIWGGAGRRLDLRGTAGWAFLSNAYSTGIGSGPVADLQLELGQPRFFTPRLHALERLELEKGLEETYSFYGGRARVGLVWRPLRHLTFSPSYNLQVYNLQQGAVSLGGTAPELLFGCPERCVLSFLEQTLAWDERDDILEPREGHYLALSFQEGGGPLGGAFRFVRILPELRAYVSFGEERRVTLAGRIALGTLLGGAAPEDTPIVARFFSGGPQMRGFGGRRLSPLVVVPDTETDSDSDGVALPVGGNGLIESSLEVRYSLSAAWGTATFLDVGTVTEGRLRTSALRELYYAVGAGIRYKTPIGPLRLDFAYRLDIGPPLPVTQSGPTPLTYPTTGSCFGLFGSRGPSAGGPEGPCSIQLSVGEAF